MFEVQHDHHGKNFTRYFSPGRSSMTALDDKKAEGLRRHVWAMTMIDEDPLAGRPDRHSTGLTYVSFFFTLSCVWLRLCSFPDTVPQASVSSFVSKTHGSGSSYTQRQRRSTRVTEGPSSAARGIHLVSPCDLWFTVLLFLWFGRVLQCLPVDSDLCSP